MPAPSATNAWARAVRLARERLGLLRLLKGSPGQVGVLATFGICLAVLPTATAVVSGWLIERMTAVIRDDAPAAKVVAPLTALGGLLLLEALAVAGQESSRYVVAAHVDGRLRRRLRALAAAPRGIGHLEEAQYADDAARASDLGGRHVLSPGAGAAGQVVLLGRLLNAVLATAVIARHSLVAAAALLVSSLVIRSLVQRQWMRLHQVVDSRARPLRRVDYWSDVAAGAGAAKEIRVFGLARWVVARRTQEAWGWAGVIWRTRRDILVHQRAAVVLSLVAVTPAFLLPGLAVRQGQLTQGELVTCLVAAWGVLGITALGMEAFEIEVGLGALRAMRRLSTRIPQAVDGHPETAPEPPGRPPEVRFEDVTFGYPHAGRHVLHRLNLRVEAGRVLALVGANGAGKTTFIKLMAGLYEPADGRVVVAGTDLADLDVRAWRRRMTVMFQDFNRYPLSVADNVALGAPEHRTDRVGILAAVERAGLAATVERLPQGVDTVVSRDVHGGVDLSGGQWQRVALARVLFAAAHGRDLIVMDEPTAHLDVHAETAFYRDVVASVAGATVVLISHRLSTVRPADRIAVLRDGRITEAGDHDSLMAADGEYARLFRLQASHFAEPGGTPRDAADAPTALS
ncbi:ABC transporter ATP-binding protein [Streptomyces sp. NPDC049687]|uniref:ABC transporter ATP-binding protein n=1 Tax=Streptomyces sp. NPDC049687 TaxID=3365596 RepID=UPI00378D3102